MKLEILTDEWRLYSYHEVNDPVDDNLDVFVDWRGQRFRCTVYTIKNISRLMTQWHATGEHRAPYFWATDVLIVPRVDSATLMQVVDDVVRLGQLAAVMYRITDDLAKHDDRDG